MIIKNIIQSLSDNFITLSADIIFKNKPSKNIFFRVDKKALNIVGYDASPFVASLLLPCMMRGEDMIVEGNVPSELITQINKIMEVVTAWNVGFKKIKVSVHTYKSIKSQQKYSGCFFTGGVDSFYTYLKNKKNISHFVLIHGCDIPLSNKIIFEDAVTSVKEIVKIEKKNLVIIESNYREIIEPILPWEWNLGSALAAAGLFLRGGFKSIYIPSGMRYDQLCPYGSHPDLDPLWSVENLKFIHDGCESSRMQKVIKISESELALKYLRVCCFNIKNQYNCNKCFKCVLTKLELLCAEALNKASSFDGILNKKNINNVYFNVDLNFHLFGQETLDFMVKNNIRADLQISLRNALEKSKRPPFLRRLTEKIASWDKKYFDRKIYTFVFSPVNNDRNLLFKTISKFGLVK